MYYLCHDAIFETALTFEEGKAWRTLPRSEKLCERFRNEFRNAGWQFGASVINIVRCPCCPMDAKADPERLATKSALEQLFGDDEDGLAATLEDYHL